MRKKLLASLAIVFAVALTIPAQADTRVGGPDDPGFWGLDRIDQTALPLDGTFTTHSDGAGVNVYVIDDGVDTRLPDFEERASIVYDKFHTANQTCQFDGGSHGTAVAGVVAGKNYGVAKKANILSVNAVDCVGGSDNGQNLLDAINWVIEDHKTRPGPAVANISRNNLGQGYFSTFQPQAVELAKAVNNLAAAGVFVTVSAGNVGTSQTWLTQWTAQTACANPPANAGAALVVAGSNRNDEFIWREPLANGNNWSSAYGECVSVVAPAQAVITDSESLDGTFQLDNGTSFAAPFAAGVAALYKATYGDASSAVVKSWITGHATPGVLTKVPSGTPNLLLNTGGL